MENGVQIKITEKELLKVSLFKHVRQVNGEKTFKLLFHNFKALHFPSKTSIPQLQQKQYFVFVRKGQALLYKQNSNSDYNSFFKSFRADDYFGFQDFPLFWNEKIIVEVVPSTQLIFIPLFVFYQCFRRIIQINSIQSKAEYMKKLQLFKEIEIEKVVKLASYSQKYRLEEDQILYNEGSQFKHIFIILSGKVEIMNNIVLDSIVFGKNQPLLTTELKQGLRQCLYTCTCLQEADLLAIPKDRFKEMMDIRYKLNESLMKSIEKRQASEEHQTYFTRRGRKLTKNKTQTGFHRPKTQIQTISQSDLQFMKKSTTQNKLKGDKSEEKGTISLSEIQWQKFMKRKETLQKRKVIKYMKSKPPETIINPSRYYAVIKPFYQSKSQYIKNQKRKLKKAVEYSQNASSKTYMEG